MEICGIGSVIPVGVKIDVISALLNIEFLWIKILILQGFSVLFFLMFR